MIIPMLTRTFKLGLKSLLRHVLRSSLTMLGIVFGVGAVVAMLAIGEGASYESQERIKSLGSDNIIIKSVKPPEDTTSSSSSNRMLTAISYGLTFDDAARIANTVPGVKVVLPIRDVRQPLSYGDHQMDGHVIATAPWYLSNTNSQHLKPGGRFISSVDMDERANVCVIGSDVVRKVFPAENPLGKALKVGSGYYIVVGMMQADTSTKQDSKSAGDVATDINSSVIIPLETAKERLGTMTGEQTAGSISFETVELHQIIVKVNDINQVLPVSQVVQGLIKKYHSKQDYEMVVPLELLKEIEKNARMFTLVLGMIAAISLLVGGIGIMNIMLASVTERTREIGIRRALGAKKRDIVVQFLSETVVLSLFGGVLGLGVGILIPVIIRSITGMHVIFTAWSLILSFSISAVVGLVFGIYPAYRAANMDPIEALRHE